VETLSQNNDKPKVVDHTSPKNKPSNDKVIDFLPKKDVIDENPLSTIAETLDDKNLKKEPIISSKDKEINNVNYLDSKIGGGGSIAENNDASDEGNVHFQKKVVGLKGNDSSQVKDKMFLEFDSGFSINDKNDNFKNNLGDGNRRNKNACASSSVKSSSVLSVLQRWQGSLWFFEPSVGESEHVADPLSMVDIAREDGIEVDSLSLSEVVKKLASNYQVYGNYSAFLSEIEKIS
jgi:hypothetical protein